MANAQLKKKEPKPKWNLSKPAKGTGDLLQIPSSISKNINDLLLIKLRHEIEAALHILLITTAEIKKGTVADKTLLAMQQHLDELFAYFKRNGLAENKSSNKILLELQQNFNKLLTLTYKPKKNSRVTVDEKNLIANITMPMIALSLSQGATGLKFDAKDKDNIVAIKILSRCIAYLDKNYLTFDREKIRFITREIYNQERASK